MTKFSTIEICAGAGGQALGLEQAGFNHLALIEIESAACETLKTNRPTWNIINGDVKQFDAKPFKNKVDLLAGGTPCPPFSIAGKQLGHLDERDLFPEALRIIKECSPKAVMLENVKGLLSPKFNEYRVDIINQLEELGYNVSWQIMEATNFGISQVRQRAILVAIKKPYFKHFAWPTKSKKKPVPIGNLLAKEMALGGWENVLEWTERARGIAPTLVGGSKKHGGPDLGPTRAKKMWALLGVDGNGIANAPPPANFQGMPKLTLEMTALVQGFPKSWKFFGKKTAVYRQIGNSFPPPVAKAVGKSIIKALQNGE